MSGTGWIMRSEAGFWIGSWKANPCERGPSLAFMLDGAPKFRPIEGTPLQYVANAAPSGF
jgi:hypothetical protein